MTLEEFLDLYLIKDVLDEHIASFLFEQEIDYDSFDHYVLDDNIVVDVYKDDKVIQHIFNAAIVYAFAKKTVPLVSDSEHYLVLKFTDEDKIFYIPADYVDYTYDIKSNMLEIADDKELFLIYNASSFFHLFREWLATKHCDFVIET